MYEEVTHMKYYLADFDIRDGDNEYDFQFLVQAENLEEAEKKAIDGLCLNFGVDRSEWDEKGEELDLFSRIIRKGNLPQEIPDNEVAILKKYFWVAPEQ
jgi:regulator of RNase E activity RraB